MMKIIQCYNCGKQGILDSEKRRRKFDCQKKQFVEYTIKINKNFSKVSLEKNLWICQECSKNKCIVCGILLSQNRSCKVCKDIHGIICKGLIDVCDECFHLHKDLIDKYIIKLQQHVKMHSM